MELLRSYSIATGENPFEELSEIVRFEDVGKGRRGAVLFQRDETRGVPLVRTTTRYRTPAQSFGPAHERLAEEIRKRASLPLALNNANIEIYTNQYTTMGAHSDQALDLADGAYIALFSCYEHPERVTIQRKLLVEPKERRGDGVEIPLPHCGVVLFSVDANRWLRHKIVLATTDRGSDNRWLGLTFRTSKTFVQYRGERVEFSDGTPLALASEDQRRDFYHLRRRENDETDFTYPRITYTISVSDLMPPDFPYPEGVPFRAGRT